MNRTADFSRPQLSPSALPANRNHNERAAAPSLVNEVLRSPGQPMDPAARAFMERRFGHDFSSVRVHADDKAALSAHAIGARAYTSGSDIVFGAGQHNLGGRQGMHLLAHELAHQVQQGSQSPTARMEIAPARSSLETEATAVAERVVQGGRISGLTSVSHQIQRQPSPGAKTATFSVVQADYLQLVQSAIQKMSGSIVTGNTLAGEINPILSAMLGKVTWRDEKGVYHGGGTVPHTLSLKPPVRLKLQLILDDDPNPPDAGRFTDDGTSGILIVRIRNNADAGELTKTLFHEALHMMSWFINKFGYSPTSNPSAPETRALQASRRAAPVRTAHAWLQRLADSVNSRRASGQDRLNEDQVQSTAEWLVEEVVVRTETEVFRLASEAQQAQQSHRGTLIIGTPQNVEVRVKEIDNYLFDLSDRFLPTDRAGLDAGDQDVLAKLAEILDSYLRDSVKRRFSTYPYTTERPTAPLPPLSPTLPSKPSFLPKIQPPD